MARIIDYCVSALLWARYKKYPPPQMVTENLIISAMAPVIVFILVVRRSIGL